MHTARAAVILAAGKGTRMRSALAKVLHEANGRPLCAYPVQAALALRCDPVVVVIGHQAEQVRSQLGALFPHDPIKFALQSEQRGTAHAVASARRALSGHDGRVLILYGDVPLITEATLGRLVAAGRRTPLAMLTMTLDDPTGYGRVVRDPRGRVASIVEHRDASAEERAIRACNAGLYDVDAKFLWGQLGKLRARNAQNELYLTDLVAAAYAAGTPAVAVEADPAEVAGVNDRVELSRAAEVLRRRVLERHMRAGVTMVDPATTFVDEDVELGEDVVLGPMVRLGKGTKVGAGARIGQGCVLERSEIDAGAVLHPYCVLEDARVGARATVGPFARLRPGAELLEDAHVGNFVELKKTRLGKGSKANHLAYLGDAVIGAGCNIGAGTITCNYDGVHKHPTVLGDGVFVGSDTQLVAPVTLGDRAYVGAGSTIVEDVPAGALALSRPAQVIKEGWVSRKRLEVKPGRAAAGRRTRR